MDIILVTGISGSGKSIAVNVLEDDGFYCIDNLPAPFLFDVIGSLGEAGHRRVAVSIDVRTGDSVGGLRDVIQRLTQASHQVKVLFLNARTDILVQRFSETRRRHPLTLQPAGSQEAPPTLMESIDRERDMMSVVEDLGLSIDTSDLHPNVLRQWVRDVVGLQRSGIGLLFESFAFKHGVPLDADLVFDVRCLPNPYYTPALRALTGLDAPVAQFLAEVPAVERMIEHISHFLQSWLPAYVQENRSYLTVAVGCTGGQHRSVYVVEQLSKRFRDTERVLVRHRGLAHRTLVG
jgi:UPF0042 nucleotide-binding protein